MLNLKKTRIRFVLVFVIWIQTSFGSLDLISHEMTTHQIYKRNWLVLQAGTARDWEQQLLTFIYNITKVPQGFPSVSQEELAFVSFPNRRWAEN